MATSQRADTNSVGLPANADLSADQYCFVDINSSGNLVLPSAGGVAVGVLQDKPNALGQEGQVAVPGCISKVVAGASLNAGAQVMTDGSGKAVLATTGHFVLGRTTEAASGAGSLIGVLLVSPYGI